MNLMPCNEAQLLFLYNFEDVHGANARARSLP